MTSPLPQKIRRQRRRLMAVVIAVGFFALVLLSLWCGSWSAQLVD